MPRPKKEPTEPTASGATATETSTSGNGTGLPSKKDMVRLAIEKGRKRKPQAIHAWIVETYNVPPDYITAQHISTIKSNLRKGGKKARQNAADASEPAAPARRGSSDSLSVDEIRVVRGLMNRIGRDRFREVIDLLS
jgi:hypothetical protein